MKGETTMYSDVQMDRLVNVLANIVSGGDGTWQEKRDAVVSAVSSRDGQANLEEFLSWFGGSIEVD